MRLNEFFSIPPAEISVQIENLAVSASDAIASMKAAGRFLYRGIRRYGLDEFPIFTATTQPNREPQGQRTDQQKALDKVLADYGFTSLRHNSICCTSSHTQTARFGRAFIIFPHNGFSFTWSNILDIGSNRDTSKQLTRSLKNIIAGNSWNENLPRIVTKYDSSLDGFMNYFSFRKDDFVTALTSQCEITVTGTYTVVDNRLTKKVNEILGIGAKIEQFVE